VKTLSRDKTSKLDETQSIPNSSQFSEALCTDSDYVSQEGRRVGRTSFDTLEGHTSDA